MRKMQKALHLHLEEDKKNPKYRGKEYYIFEKYDGWYGYMDTEVGKIMSSAGREIPSVKHIAKYVHAHSAGRRGGRLIFEIMVKDKPFSILNGILNRKAAAKDVYLMVHDFIPTEELDMEFHKRYEQAGFAIEGMNHDVIRMAPVLGISSDKFDWKNWARKVWDKGGEGVILKASLSPYEFGKRNSNILKIKEELTVDLRVMGMIEGQGKYKGTLGALKVVGKKGKVHTVSGMTDAQRAEWWADPKTIGGKVVEVRAMKLLADGSLREPRFKAVRHDKDREDIDDV